MAKIAPLLLWKRKSRSWEIQPQEPEGQLLTGLLSPDPRSFHCASPKRRY